MSNILFVLVIAAEKAKASIAVSPELAPMSTYTIFGKKIAFKILKWLKRVLLGTYCAALCSSHKSQARPDPLQPKTFLLIQLLPSFVLFGQLFPENAHLLYFSTWPHSQ